MKITNQTKARRLALKAHLRQQRVVNERRRELERRLGKTVYAGYVGTCAVCGRDNPNWGFALAQPFETSLASFRFCSGHSVLRVLEAWEADQALHALEQG